MLQTFFALIPIFLVIVFGYVLKHIKFPTAEFWDGAEKIVYYIFFPALLIYKLSTARVDLSSYINLLFVGIISITILFILLVIFRKVIGGTGANYSSVIQGAIRFNTYVFLALVDLFYGSEGLVVAAVLISFAIPYLNILSIAGFALYVGESKASFVSVVKSIIKNPLIIACFVGGLINTSGLYIPSIVEDSLKIVSSAALPLGLLCVGVGLELKISLTDLKDLVVSTFFKLVVLSAITFLLCKYVHLSELEFYIVMLFSAMPTASSAYILSRQLGGNSSLMASIITYETLISIFTISLLMKLI